jgi:hypothetical protein
LLAVEIHLVGQPNESFESVRLQVLSPSHRPHYCGEAMEVVSLDDEWIALEERNDIRFEIDQSVDRVRTHVAPGSLGADMSAPEHWTQALEHFSIPLVLIDVEDGVQLPPACRSCVCVPVYRHRKATLSIDESYDSTRIEIEHRPDGFLLIVRTGRIFTAHALTLRTG